MIKRYHYDPDWETLDESPTGDWCRFDDCNGLIERVAWAERLLLLVEQTGLLAKAHIDRDLCARVAKFNASRASAKTE
jgi:hypothetical protein